MYLNLNSRLFLSMLKLFHHATSTGAPPHILRRRRHIYIPILAPKKRTLSDEVFSGRVREAQEILETGVDPDKAENSGGPPLFIAASDNKEEMVHLLLLFDAEPNIQRSDRSTPLFISAYKGYESVVRRLLNYGANPATPAYLGATPIFAAAENGHVCILRLLLDAPGADATKAKDDGTTPLEIAGKNGHTAAATMLKAHIAAAKDVPVKGTPAKKDAPVKEDNAAPKEAALPLRRSKRIRELSIKNNKGGGHHTRQLLSLNPI